MSVTEVTEGTERDQHRDTEVRILQAGHSHSWQLRSESRSTKGDGPPGRPHSRLRGTPIQNATTRGSSLPSATRTNDLRTPVSASFDDAQDAPSTVEGRVDLVPCPPSSPSTTGQPPRAHQHTPSQSRLSIRKTVRKWAGAGRSWAARQCETRKSQEGQTAHIRDETTWSNGQTSVSRFLARL